MTNNPQAQITNLYASYFCIHNYEIIISSSKTASTCQSGCCFQNHNIH